MRILTFVALAANILLWWVFLLWPPSSFNWAARPTMFALAATAASAVAGMVLIHGWWQTRGPTMAEPSVPSSRLGWITALGIVVAGALLLAGILTNGARPIPAAMILLLGGGALFTIVAAAERLIAGSEVEVSSHWGGLGGSLGGWRISQTAILLLLGLILASAVVIAGNGLETSDVSNSVDANTSLTAGKDARVENSQINEVGADANATANQSGNASVGDSVANSEGAG